MVKTFFPALKTPMIPLYSDMCFGYVLVLTNIASIVFIKIYLQSSVNVNVSRN